MQIMAEIAAEIVVEETRREDKPGGLIVERRAMHLQPLAWMDSWKRWVLMA